MANAAIDSLYGGWIMTGGRVGGFETVWTIFSKWSC